MCVDLYVCKSSWGEHVALFQGDAGPQEPFSRRCAFRPWRKGDSAKAREVWGLGSQGHLVRRSVLQILATAP